MLTLIQGFSFTLILWGLSHNRVGGREHIKQNKSTGSNKVFDTIEEFYNIE